MRFIAVLLTTKIVYHIYFFNAIVFCAYVCYRGTLYVVDVDREGGVGKYDVVVKPRNMKTPPRGFVFEFKRAGEEKRLAKGVEKALALTKE
jgi:hypothetical protein